MQKNFLVIVIHKNKKDLVRKKYNLQNKPQVFKQPQIILGKIKQNLI